VTETAGGSEPAPPSGALARRRAGIVVGSSNPAKLAAVRQMAGQLLPGHEVTGLDTISGVSDQPSSDEEALRGAENRARAAMRALPSAFAVGIESGISSFADGLFSFTWVAILSSDGEMGRACSARIELPAAIAAELVAGLDLETAMLKATREVGLGTGGGAFGHLTGGTVTRTAATLQALHLAFTRFTFMAP
jgi:inosine/xanthosine triphosphatase